MLIKLIGLPHHNKGSYKVPDVDSGFFQRQLHFPDRSHFGIEPHQLVQLCTSAHQQCNVSKGGIDICDYVFEHI